VAIKPKVTRCKDGKVKPRKHGTSKRYRKRCQYPEGCEGCASIARGSTMFCKAHGGGKRCQYPESCDTLAGWLVCHASSRSISTYCEVQSSINSSIFLLWVVVVIEMIESSGGVRVIGG
jgi:hypothetical protein